MAGQDHPPRTSLVWRWRHAVANSDLPATTRHVLTMLGNKMDRNGGSCFPTIDDLCALTGRTKKTVRAHLKIASDRGWLEVRHGFFSGQKWRRQDYRARWPDAPAADQGSGDTPADYIRDDEEVRQMAAQGGGIDAPKVGEQLPQDNNSPINSPESAGARADGNERRKIEAAFLRWLPSWPGYADYSAHKARREWFRLKPAEREACISLTPGWLQWSQGKNRVRSPAEYLRTKPWEKLPADNRVHAAYCGKLWMAHRLSLLLKPAVESFVVTTFDRRQIDDGKITVEALMRAKRMASGWPEANAMIDTFRSRRKLFISPVLAPIASGFRQAERSGEVFLAWKRLHARRGWPFIEQPADWVFFPAIDDVSGDLDAQVEAALAAFEQKISEVQNG